MQLNEDSFKEISKVTDRNYYFRLDDKNRLTLEITDQKDLQECVAITTYTIQQIAKMPVPENGWVTTNSETNEFTTLAKTIEQSHKDSGGKIK